MRNAPSKRAQSNLRTARRRAEYAQQHVIRWNGRFDKLAGKRVNELDIVIGSDFHSVFVDPFALAVFIDVIKNLQPDAVVLNGDVFDFPQVGSYRKMPGHFRLTLQQEINFGRDEILAAVREAAPNATIYFVIGNHEYRLVNYLADNAPELADLDCMEFDKLLQIKDLEISLVCRSSFMAPTLSARRKDVRENWVEIGGAYVCTHGTSIAKFAADKQLLTFQKSGTSGHTHRPQVYSTNSLGTGPISWMSTPMMANYTVGREYIPEVPFWQMGFGVATVNTKSKVVSQHLVTVHDDWATFAGMSWSPTKTALRERARMIAV